MGAVYHSNHQEAKIIASVFNQLGYNVDIVEHYKKVYIDFSRYDIIFGFGQTFKDSFNCKSFKGKRINYGTGAHVCHQNTAELLRVQAVNKKYNTKLFPKRLVTWTWSLSTGMSDALVCLGNEWVMNTFRKHTHAPIYMLKATGIQHAKKHFLWFNGLGLVHKGLDLCLEAFQLRPDLELHICGYKENDFFEVFRDFF